MKSLHHRQDTAIGLSSWRIVRLVGAAVTISCAPTRVTTSPNANIKYQVTPSLVLDGVTVIDVVQGRAVPDQRVVVTGTRIQAVGSVDSVPMPNGGQVVKAQGKYLIPGLWDMHTHAVWSTELFYPLFLANGVTGIRDAGSSVPLDSLIRWRREILEGRRVGPPRQLLSGPSLTDVWQENGYPRETCNRGEIQRLGIHQTCVSAVDSNDIRHLVDSLKGAGADMIKPRDVTRGTYFTIAAEARRVGIPFGGHVMRGNTTIEASDSGASIIDHDWGQPECASYAKSPEPCQKLAQYLRSRGTWFVPTMILNTAFSGILGGRINERLSKAAQALWAGAPFAGNWLHDALRATLDSVAIPSIVHVDGIPILAGTDVMGAHKEFGRIEQGNINSSPPGLSLHVELAVLVANGLTPLSALQSATLNPAMMLHATDSLGTVAPGKLADLVLLDGNPLTDISNTTTIRAVVANGRYFDRAALDRILRVTRSSHANIPRITLDHPTVTLSTMAPHNTLQLSLTQHDTLGRPVTGQLSPIYRSLDTSRVQVTTDGLMTALQEGTNIQVIAGLKNRPMVVADTMLVNVTALAAPPRLRSLSIAPVSPDSGMWAMPADFLGMAIGFLRRPKLSPRVVDTTGAEITGLPIEYTSLDTAVAIIDRWTGEVTLIRSGRVRIATRTTAYGISRADTAIFTVTMPLSRDFAIKTGAAGVPVFDSRGQNEVRIAPHGIVFWSNSLGDTVDVTFDDPTDVNEPPATLCGTFPAVFGHPGNYCGSGNVLVPQVSSDTTGGSFLATMATLRARQFPKPGVYPFHSVRTGATGRIVVTANPD